METATKDTAKQFTKFSEVLAILLVFFGVLTLIGWLLNISILKTPGPAFSTIKSNVSFSVILLGVSLFLLQSDRVNTKYRRVAQILTAVAALIGILTVGEYLLGINLGIDQILFREAPGALYTSSPNRMAFTAALNLIIAGTALILIDSKLLRISQNLAIVGGVITSLAILGYAYNSPLFYNPLPNYTRLAIYATFIFILMFSGIIMARPNTGFMKTMTSQNLGSYLLRRYLPVVILLPVFLGWLWIIGENLGYYDPAFGYALYTISTILLLTAFLWYVSNSINIIDRKRQKIEEELKISNSYNRNLIESNLDALFSIDPQGIITDVNSSTEQITGYPRDILIGSNFSNYFTSPEKARAVYQRVFNKGSVRDYRLDIDNKDDSTPVLYNANIQKNDSGDPIGVLASARDITELRRAQMELKDYKNNLEEQIEERTAELEETNEDLKNEIAERKITEIEMERLMDELKRSNRELQQFAYVASHDLQEPIRMIASFTQLLERRYKGKLDDDADDFIKFIVEGATRMQHLIEDLLTYSHVTTRAEPFNKIDLEDVFKESIANLKLMIDETNAEITHDPLPSLSADRSQIIQLFQNLIGNSLKFKGKEDPKIHISVNKDDYSWIFEFSDNGIGIAPDHQERIFRVFQRLHTREEYPGTGIGLAVCEKIVQRHGGRIWIESKPGDGAKFFFTLPID